jgi:predicted double-glycine peptidase
MRRAIGVRRMPPRLLRIIHRIAVAWGAIALGTTGLSAQIGIGSSGLRIDPPARSMKDLRDQGVVKQRFDFSCGAAALATLMRYGFGQDVTESQILVRLFDLPTEAEKLERERTGFSLLDLQRVAQARGYNAEGFRIEPDQLTMLGGPVIVFIEPRGYKHFAVFRGIRGDRVHLADPSRGNIRLPLYSFLDSWLQADGRGIIFAAEPKAGQPAGASTLSLIQTAGRGRVRPELLSVREMLEVGNALVRPPRPSP